MSKMVWKLLAGTVLVVAAANPAEAAIFVQTWTGVVTEDSYDGSEFFGGGDLTGLSFTAVYTFDDEKGVRQNSATTRWLLGGSATGRPTPIISAKLTINGLSYTLNGDWMGQIYVEQSPNFSQALSYAGETFDLNMYNNVYDDLNRGYGNPAFSFSGSVADAANNDGQFSNGSTLVNMKNLTYSVSAGSAAAVPQPATWAMMLAGFGVVGCAMRRRRQVGVRFS